MIFLRPAAFIDVWSLQSVLWRQRKLFEEGPVGDPPYQHTRSMIFDAARLEDQSWATLKRMLARVRKLMSGPDGPPIFDKIVIESLLPGGHIDWHTGEGDGVRRFHAAIITNPASILYAGTEFINLPVGQVFEISTTAKTSAINLGTTPRLHLIVDVKIAEE